MLSWLSISFLVLNCPYFVVILVSFFAFSNSEEHRRFNFDKKLIIYLTIVEILQLAHYCVSGFILFLSGKLFRSHLKRRLTCRL